jgi:hypothetical protein
MEKSGQIRSAETSRAENEFHFQSCCMFGVCEADRPIFPKKKAWFHGRGCEDGADAQTMQKNESDRCQISTQAQVVFYEKRKQIPK